MNRRMGVVLVVITLVSLGLAIEGQVQLRKARTESAAAREVVAQDLSGAPAAREPGVAAPAAADTAAVQRAQQLQRQVAALQAERDKLQSDLAAAQMTLADRAKDPARAAATAPSTNQPRRASFEDRMAQMQRDDPARYAEFQKQREEFAKRIQTQADERSDFLKQVDTAGMTEDQRVNHEKLLQAVEQARTLMAQIATMSPEDAATARRQMFETVGNVSDLYQQERRYLLEQTGRAMGYPGAESGQFADYIQQIYDQTSLPRGFGRGGPGGGRDRGPGTGTAGSTGGATGTTGTGTPAPAPAR